MIITQIGNKYRLKGLGGIHNIGPLRHHIRTKLLMGLIPILAYNIVHSQSSLSVYFTYNGRNYRVSDHFSDFDGIQLIV